MKLDTIYINIEPVQGKLYEVSVSVELQRGWEVASFTLENVPTGEKPPALPAKSIRYGTLRIKRDNSSAGGVRTKSLQVERQEGELVVHVDIARNNIVHEIPTPITQLNRELFIEQLNQRIETLQRALKNSKSELILEQIENLEVALAEAETGDLNVITAFSTVDTNRGRGGSGSYEP